MILLALPVVYGVLLHNKRESMKEYKTNVRFGSLFLGIRNYSHLQVFYSVLFLIRRLVFVCVLVFLEDNPGIAVQLVLALNLTFSVYFAEVNPHTSLILYRLEIVNEWIL